ncbi:peptidoglycan-associated lipoprotein Pal [Psychromonas sp. RZ22]|uniref:peptidoglycan-associated lipoprotein Pal n=1 Tax=Psychromonas algarum TaxID=2555643 RepID=UPI0010688C4A|nr:peptidoglycan-associated lipoprotein Pal [Psychromonas sp. RZ22]TEW53415.1 peptidoglycan-associated lipoprotein Pal [Psychromonas sp. RZ22]
MNLSMISKSLLIALPMLALSACSSNTDADAASAENNGSAPAAETTQASNDGVETNAVEAVELTPEEQLAEKYSNAILETTINFEFDQSLIKPEYAKILDAHAKYLVDNPDKSITIEGHTDEKGTPEYNIALGERRGLAVSTYLENMGVAASQLTVVSYGEEKPVNHGHDESAWSENRRAELVY